LFQITNKQGIEEFTCAFLLNNVIVESLKILRIEKIINKFLKQELNIEHIWLLKKIKQKKRKKYFGQRKLKYFGQRKLKYFGHVKHHVEDNHERVYDQRK
jgi:hypothetical protein